MNSPNKSIAEIAYELWEARGRPDGSHEQDWAEAERLASRSPASPPNSVDNDESVIESFPASDPPASRIPDVPPSNADAKWKSAATKRAPAAPKKSTPGKR